MVFVVAGGALVVGLLLIVLIARYAPDGRERPRGAEAAGRVPMPFEEFRRLVVDLVEALGLEIVLSSARPPEVDLVVRSHQPLSGGRFLVRAIWEAPGDVVDQAEVLRLEEEARADQAAKGVLMTPWAIRADGLSGLEKPIELIDGAALRALVEKHLGPERLVALGRYRGFGT